MTTARDWIESALRANGALAFGESLDADDAAVALDRLNLMLDSWSLEPGIVHAVTVETFPTVAGTAAYSSTLLSGGRPYGVNNITVSDGTADYPVDIAISAATYAALTDKTTPGIPSLCWLNMGYPDATFTFWPVPFAVYTVKVGLWRAVQDALALNTTVTVPPGYGKAIVDSLAVDVAGSFGKQPNALLMQSAREAKAWVKRANHKPGEMDTGVWGGRGQYDINGDS